MRILVTGAAGFIGSHVAEAYRKRGHEVAGIDNLATGNRQNLSPEIPLWEVDLADEETLKPVFCQFQPEVVSHHAAQVNLRLSWERPIEDACDNVLGSLALLRQSLRYGVRRVIYSSSAGAVYGEPSSMPVTEEQPIRPISNYGVSKYTVELYIRAFHANSGLPYVILRYPNVYGPRQDPKGEAGAVAIFTCQLLQGEQPRIFGDGTKTRDYVYIDDIVDANLRALSCEDCGVFNLGWGKEISDLEVFEAVRDAVGLNVQPVFDRKRPGEIDRIAFDATRAANRLGWKPRIEFHDGVERVVAYWRRNSVFT